MVDIRRIAADFRDAFERTQTSAARASGVNKFFTSQSPLQRKLSVYNWHPGPRRGAEDAVEKQNAGKWHFTLQEKLLTMSNTKYSLGRLCSSLQQGYLLPQRRCQVHLPPRHQADIARSFCRKRTWIWFTRKYITRLLSACCIQWSNRLHRLLFTHQQCVC